MLFDVTPGTTRKPAIPYPFIKTIPAKLDNYSNSSNFYEVQFDVVKKSCLFSPPKPYCEVLCVNSEATYHFTNCCSRGLARRDYPAPVLIMSGRLC